MVLSGGWAGGRFLGTIGAGGSAHASCHPPRRELRYVIGRPSSPNVSHPFDETRHHGRVRVGQQAGSLPPAPARIGGRVGVWSRSSAVSGGRTGTRLTS